MPSAERVTIPSPTLLPYLVGIEIEMSLYRLNLKSHDIPLVTALKR